jgi:hypothetical protein
VIVWYFCDFNFFYFLIQVSPCSTFLNISSFNYITIKIDIPIIKLYYEKKLYFLVEIIFFIDTHTHTLQ